LGSAKEGEKMPIKVSEEKKQEMCKEYAVGETTYKALAQKNGVSLAFVAKLCAKNKTSNNTKTKKNFRIPEELMKAIHDLEEKFPGAIQVIQTYIVYHPAEIIQKGEN
jgi:transposase-like protein